MYTYNLKACLVCLSTEGKMCKIDSGQLKSGFFYISGLKEDDLLGMPRYFCVECAAYINKFRKFREKCKRAHFTLKQILHTKKQVTVLTLEAINHKKLGIGPSLSYLNLDSVHYETAKFKWEKHNRLGLTIDHDIPVFQCSTHDEENEFEVPVKKRKQSNCITDNIIIKEEIEVPVTNNDDQSTLEINNDFFFDEDCCDNGENAVKIEIEETTADGSNLEEEYASVVPISMKEAEAVLKVYNCFSNGKFACEICEKMFFSEKQLARHLRMHSQLSGDKKCVLCKTYYKTDFLLKTHMTEKHMYKYLCRKCPEVSFDRVSAKQHYIWTHLRKGNKKDLSWYDVRPTWMTNKGGPRRKGVCTIRPVRKNIKLPEDFPIYSPVSQEEQYKLMQDRKKSRNYIEALFKCELCYRGFRENETYSKHMKKHDPEYAGPLQCDMCKVHFRDTRRVYKHMIVTHVFKYSCQMCSFQTPSRGQAQMHYRWHKNVMYPCPHCDKEFKKASTRLTHIRIKHPSTNICSLCGHSFVGENGLYCHKRIAHSKEEVEAADAMAVDASSPFYCEECQIQFVSLDAYTTHLGSSNKHASVNLSIKPSKRIGTTGKRRKYNARSRFAAKNIVNTGVTIATTCEICGCGLASDVAARRHYEAEHPRDELMKRYMCDQCGHTTRQYANLVVHMRTHTQEKPYTCPHCDRRFSMPGNRDRHLVVHTGEKKYQCQHCSRRFTQSSAVKLHIQTVHLKIPYAPWDKKNRKRRKELESMGCPLLPAPLPPACAPPPPPPPPQPRLHIDTQGDYLNAYITYND